MNRRKNTNGTIAGFGLLESMIVIAVIMVLVGMAIPKFIQAISNYKLRAAADSVAWAMQSTRYQALQKGYTYELTVNSANNTYQVLSRPVGASGFSNVGGAVPLTSAPVVVGATTTLTFSPNGSIAVVTGSQTLTLTYSGLTETVTVTNYGSVTVTP
jgi:Tfp pilus assembly protein FimT